MDIILMRAIVYNIFLGKLSMNTKILFSALAVVCIMLLSVSAEAKRVVIENQTGMTIRELYISHVNTDDWETDMLRPEESNMRLLHNGQSVVLNLTKGDYYDLLAVFQDRSEYRYDNIDIDTYRRIIINRYDMTMMADQRLE